MRMYIFHIAVLTNKKSPQTANPGQLRVPPKGTPLGLISSFPTALFFGAGLSAPYCVGRQTLKISTSEFTLPLQLHLKENLGCRCESLILETWWCRRTQRKRLTLSLDANHPQLGKTTPRRTFAGESV